MDWKEIYRGKHEQLDEAVQGLLTTLKLNLQSAMNKKDAIDKLEKFKKENEKKPEFSKIQVALNDVTNDLSNEKLQDISGLKKTKWSKIGA